MANNVKKTSLFRSGSTAKIVLACVVCLALSLSLEAFFFNFQFWNTRASQPIQVSSENTVSSPSEQGKQDNQGMQGEQGEQDNQSKQEIQENQSAQSIVESDSSQAVKQGVLTLNEDTFSTSMYIEPDESTKQQEAVHNPERKQLIFKNNALDVGEYTRNKDAAAALQNGDEKTEEASPNKRSFTFSLNNQDAQNGASASMQDTSVQKGTEQSTQNEGADLQTLWFSYSTEEPITVEVELKDEGHELYQYQCSITLERTTGTNSSVHEQLVCLHPVGKASSARITVDAMRSYSLDVAFNKPANFSFNLQRFFAFAFVFLLIFALRPKSRLRGVPAKRMHYLLIGVACCIFAFVFAYMRSSELAVDATAESQYADLAKALAQGQFFLSETPPEQLAQLSNPYDNALRDASGISARWDTAYFQGRYYVYFGILPVLLLHLPFYLLTGGVFPNWLATAIFSSLFIAGVLFLIHALAKMLNKQLSLAVLLLVFCSILAVSFISNALRFPAIYVVCISCAMALVVWGMSFWVKALTPARSAKDKGQIRLGWAFAGSAFMAATILARPTFLLYSLFGVGLLFMVYMLHKHVKPALCMQSNACANAQQENVKLAGKSIGASTVVTSDKSANASAAAGNDKSTKTTTKNSTKTTTHNVVAIIVSILPYLLFFGIAAYYNNARFASPFDFGSSYNLTSNDLVHRGFDLQRSISGMFVYLLQLPNYQLNFPYLGTTYAAQGYNGVLSVERSVGGLFMLFPVLLSFALIASSKVKKSLAPTPKALLPVFIGIFIACILAFFDANAAGIMERYYMDFGLALALSFAMFLVALLPKKLPSRASKSLEPLKPQQASQNSSSSHYFIFITFSITIINALVWIGTATSVFS